MAAAGQAAERAACAAPVTLRQRRDDVPAIDEFIDGTELGSGLVDFSYQLIRRQPFICSGIEQETDESFEVEIVGRHAGNNVPAGSLPSVWIRHGGVYGAGMAGGAVEPDYVDVAIGTERNADRQIALMAAGVALVDKTECRIILAAGEILGKQRG
jgi:hypothetical protein